jgi:hypothetical protein
MCMDVHRAPPVASVLSAILGASVAAVLYVASPFCKAPGTDSLQPFLIAVTRTHKRNAAQSRAQSKAKNRTNNGYIVRHVQLLFVDHKHRKRTATNGWNNPMQQSVRHRHDRCSNQSIPAHHIVCSLSGIAVPCAASVAS